MSDSTPAPKRPPSDAHITDLLAYPADLKAFEAYVKQHVRTKEDAERLLREFDEYQRSRWRNLTVEE